MSPNKSNGNNARSPFAMDQPSLVQLLGCGLSSRENRDGREEEESGFPSLIPSSGMLPLSRERLLEAIDEALRIVEEDTNDDFIQDDYSDQNIPSASVVGHDKQDSPAAP